MIIVDCAQNSPEWNAARLGLPTASEFAKIITPTGLPSTQAEAYVNKLLAEQMIGHAIDGYKSLAMQEGNDREAESVAFYEFQKNVVTTPVGFVLHDSKFFGCSPDRLVGDDGLLEAKNPEAHTQIAYLLGKKIDKTYWPQIQGQLYVTGRKWVDILSYVPEMPEVIIRIDRDESYITKMGILLAEFCEELGNKRLKLIEQGYMKA